MTAALPPNWYAEYVERARVAQTARVISIERILPGPIADTGRQPGRPTPGMTLIPSQAKDDPSQHDIAECAAYERQADARQEAWNASVFSAAVDTLFQRR